MRGHPLGRGELLQFERDIERVAISEPKIADAVVVSPREIMVNAKSAGKASLVVWEAASSAPGRFNNGMNLHAPYQPTGARG